MGKRTDTQGGFRQRQALRSSDTSSLRSAANCRRDDWYGEDDRQRPALDAQRLNCGLCVTFNKELRDSLKGSNGQIKAGGVNRSEQKLNHAEPPRLECRVGHGGTMELQLVKPKRNEDWMPWVFPSIGFELCRREVAPYFTLCILTGNWITRIRLYWNVQCPTSDKRGGFLQRSK